MFYKFEFHVYRRKFIIPLNTAHGIWKNRDGIILCLSDEMGKVGWGEIAPISWFGSETLEEAVSFCKQLPQKITQQDIFSIPEKLPACQFGFESAQEMVIQNNSASVFSQNLTYSGLLPAGKAALNQWQELWENGTNTFKWKIGVYSITEELSIFELLIRELPAFTKLRLDANGGLSYDDAEIWLQKCDDIDLEVEFIEQPLSVNLFSQMLELSRRYSTKIALDESVATIKQLENCYQKGWREIFVIKAGIIGSPSRLRQFCSTHQIDTVFSSVFETSIARKAALSLAVELSHQKRAVGFGVNHYFAEDEEVCLEQLWKKT
ncbi:o-succinylbenzoate synthase [Plectonema cf. radiosum LEGE 06105]|uniref:o-succinylbenzoate synthase n=1 Tax=Plectonema cf. radiosum LEGE 06105 TaxID=945769 RepID=A0A8J7JV03_9CYAN|nr:o-succinylbenzoate synthase [Plectonema radiosum]MBE9214060.1 o-succinylbenzoate synthase [Plectonema cf. radiosum LEGE 06105]